ncbi:MAG TPA: hypothetical protein DCQ31_06865 [Bacteroidales bacterium]|nr:hypothetical protein [Bacteroidales bacterium]
MKNLIVVFAVVSFIFTSCTTVKFETAQPAGGKILTEFPKKFVGSYSNSDKDTLIIMKSSYIQGKEKESKLAATGNAVEGESVLKKLGKNYVLSIKDEKAWEVVVITSEKNTLGVLYINLETDKEQIINNLKATTSTKEFENDEGRIEYYLVNPTKKEFKNLIKKNVFTRTMTFEKFK